MKVKITVLSWLLIGILALGSGVMTAASVQAATLEDINADDVFLKQKAVDGHCTLVSVTMMIRRYALLRGDEDWADIVEDTVAPVAWTYSGIKYGICYESSGGSIETAHDALPGGSENKELLIDLLEEHPEGIVIYYTGAPHAVLLTDYTDGVFYCAEPACTYPEGRIPLDESFQVRADNVTAYWYITSPAVEVEESEEEPTVVTVLPTPWDLALIEE